MNFHFLRRCLGFMALLLWVPMVQAYSTEDAIALRAQTPVVDGSLSPDIAAIQARGVLREVVSETAAPPFTEVDSEGNWAGFNVDLGQEVAKALGVKLVIIAAKDYNDVVNTLAAGNADIGVGLSMLPIREARVSFSDPYYSYHPHMLVNRLQASQAGWSTADEVINGLKVGKKPLKVCVFSDNFAAQILVQAFTNAQVILYDNRQQCFQDIASGKIFANIGATPVTITDFFQKNPQAALRTEDLALEQEQDLLGIAMPWQDFHLREWLNIFIDYREPTILQQEFSQQYGDST